MAFFDEIGKKISQTTQDVVQKTKDTTETLKLNNMISDEEKRIKNLYTEIGKAYFELHSDSCEEALKPYIDGIKDAHAKIGEYSEQVKRLKGIGKCPNCGADVPNTAPFCTNCGLKMNIQSANPAANTSVAHCTGCGSPLNPGSAFCTKCGKKVEQPAAEPAPAQAPTPTVRVCTNCGNELADGVNFCTKCGTRAN